MPTRYCKACSAGTAYAIKPPTFCSECGEPYVKTAARVAPPVAAPVSQSTPPAPPLSRATRARPPRDEDDDQPFDPSEMEASAAELAASLSVSDFFSSVSAPDIGVKLGDAIDPTKDLTLGQRGGVVTDPSQLPALPE